MCTGLEIAALVGAAASVGGTVMGGQAAKKAGAAAGDNELADSRERAGKIRKLAKQVRGEATAAQAASGVSVSDGGTTDLVQQDIAYNSELDALAEEISGRRRAAALRKGGAVAQKASVLNAAAIGAQAYGGWQRSAKGLA